MEEGEAIWDFVSAAGEALDGEALKKAVIGLIPFSTTGDAGAISASGSSSLELSMIGELNSVSDIETDCEFSSSSSWTMGCELGADEDVEEE